MVDKVKAPERLLNLTLALLHTRSGLTKQEILSSVQGYREDYKPFGNNDSMERQFERDKEALIITGIPWEVFTPPSEGENNQEARYRISRERFEWPKGTERLTEHQVMLLNLAGRAWNQNSMSSDAARGLFKLRALAETDSESELIGLAPRIQTHHPSFGILSQAVGDNRVVEFGYRKPGQAKSELRRLQPWGLKNIDGQWLVFGWDELRQDIRNFLLQRINPPRVQLKSESFAKPSEAQLQEADDLLNKHVETQVAIIAVQPATRAWLHFGMDHEPAKSGNQRSIFYMDLHLLAAELRQFGSDVEVLEPESLRNEIRSGFEKVASAHHG